MRIPSVRLLLGFAVLTVAIPLSDARADDAARDAIHKAIKTQLEVPAYRLKSSCVDMVSFKTWDVTTEVVNPGQVHTVRNADKTLELESFTDGKRLLTRDRKEGELKEQTGADVADKIKKLRDAALLTEPEKQHDVRKNGQKTINGIPASGYIVTSTDKSLNETTTLWIADADNRVLKTERTLKGELSFLNKTTRLDMSWETTYEYDPSITVTLPAH
jgi:hypothetical protein